jgi:pimeloyl-ACP methyl ester carboxylesterase
MTARIRLLAVALFAVLPWVAFAQSPAIGVVLMHGKGGQPGRHVSVLASALERQGILVANLEMPWSGRRNYDVDVEAADREVDAAVQVLRARGAAHIFVAGHSQGGVYALHYGSTHAVDGVIAVAPGGNVGSPAYRKEVAVSVAQARSLVAGGKGAEKASLLDYEGSRGAYPLMVAPAIYLSWFDPEGAMNQVKSSKAMDPRVPVLFVAPRNDYPALARIRQAMFAALPANPLTRMVEPDASHIDAPGAASEEVLRWMAEVVASRK